MTIVQIISSDGYVHDIAKKNKDAETIDARFYFPHVSDYILGALREKKPFIFKTSY